MPIIRIYHRRDFLHFYICSAIKAQRDQLGVRKITVALHPAVVYPENTISHKNQHKLVIGFHPWMCCIVTCDI